MDRHNFVGVRGTPTAQRTSPTAQTTSPAARGTSRGSRKVYPGVSPHEGGLGGPRLPGSQEHGASKAVHKVHHGFSPQQKNLASRPVVRGLSHDNSSPRTVRIHFRGDPGFSTQESGFVTVVVPGGQAAHRGVKVGWQVDSIAGHALGTSPQMDLRIDRQIKMAVAYQGDFCIDFSCPSNVDDSKVKAQIAFLAQETLSEEERCDNLERLYDLNRQETEAVLNDPATAQRLLAGTMSDEISVLFRDRSPGQVRESFALWETLRNGGVPFQEPLPDVVDYEDSSGNCPMHMARTAQAVLWCLQLHQHSLVEKRNHCGECPLESVLKAVRTEDERRKILESFLVEAPSALVVPHADGSPLALHLSKEERDILPLPLVPWPEVREVLLGRSVSHLVDGFERLRTRVGVELDHESAWKALLTEHCFGVLDVQHESDRVDHGPPRLFHNAASRERLGVVWQAIETLLVFLGDATISTPGFDDVKKVTQGLLAATRGPDRPPFDPREPYRDRFVQLVWSAQQLIATKIDKLLKQKGLEDPKTFHAMRTVPHDELHDVDVTGAIARGTAGRLRMDSRLASGTQVTDPLPLPAWALDHKLDVQTVEQLKEWKCITEAREVLEIVDVESVQVSVPGVTSDRLRFGRLHAAWVRSFCDHRQSAVRSRLQSALGFDGCTSFPCKVRGSLVLNFRTRLEAKGLPRVLEKMTEALEEEFVGGRSQEVLNQDVSEHSEAEVTAWKELLTPACYVCDINGAEIEFECWRDLLQFYGALRRLTLANDLCQVVRTKNGFSEALSDADVSAHGGYRDVKVWVLVSTDYTLPVELQLHVKWLHDFKSSMHLLYQCARGSFDHPHLLRCWQFEPAPKCCGCQVL